MTFTRRLKRALTGDPEARFVYLNNFEVERVWGQSEPGLPGSGFSFSGATVNRMEEVGVLHADVNDMVVLKAPVDEEYLAYLQSLDAARGQRLTVENNVPNRSVTQDALASPRLLEHLRGLDDGHTFLAPLGISPDEERLSEVTGLPLSGPSAAVCRHVNGKIFSRELVDDTGLTRVPGAVCRTYEELEEAIAAHLGEGSRVVVKESLGVSGRGMVVLDGRRRADQLLRMLARRGRQAPVSLVVEEWIDKRSDLNYQFTVDRDGATRFETVKTALTQDGVHRGHRFPPDLRPDEVEDLRSASAVIGKRLADEGYYGLVGVDAMLGTDGTLYPCLEINARFNMATYQNRVAETLFGPAQHALATVIHLRPTRTYAFSEVSRALGTLLYRSPGGTGVLINNYATLNAAVTPGKRSAGRLYAICVADTPADAEELRSAAEQALLEMVNQ
ncbi:ATP-grasp domain-containing protein [Streptomyces sp. DT2A-34]|uniref:preATP grasp domain-containing protein n=1 Tax=Streptomyces sp. DT2A-34 TaxID=3051182 RepID=UPI00265BAD06|nr:ATP-grasp domain-containing protein [Streptomyces sp. DT2A-34]MDO0912062.1 ATP-grasp domain-containing protein [Streptomyces sp. DT2A-34]